MGKHWWTSVKAGALYNVIVLEDFPAGTHIPSISQNPHEI